jgi:aminopeptidase N
MRADPQEIQMRSETAPAIRLEDYQPPAYRIDAVHLNVDLHPSATEVTATLNVCRQPETAAGTPLVLDGDDLTLKGIRVNGKALPGSAFEADADRLEIFEPPTDAFELTLVTEIDPSANTMLMGLYRSSGTYCTQCEAEGFRRITYFLDRPDILAVYTTRLEASKSECPVLLANGNPVEAGDIPGGDRHFAVWHDPHPKPAYLFALVAGNLAEVADSFTTASGRPVSLNIYVEHGKADRCGWAMDCLKRSMRWDEDVFGASTTSTSSTSSPCPTSTWGRWRTRASTSSTTSTWLADPETATDQDYANIEAVIAHEYFHNWTGNRITCRDWFQLCLKEGLTVFRDQEFSSDMRSRAVKRISDVRLLRRTSFPRTPARWRIRSGRGSYHEINNFYTATVYEKGAEVVRMLKTLLGDAAFRAGLDLYFQRHDGEATTIEAFLKCFEEAAGTDLSRFALWYEQAGTPVIPLRFALIGPNGKDMETAPPKGTRIEGDALIFDKAHQKVRFENVASRPVLSLLRGFSAPVRLNRQLDPQDLVFLASHDSDPFNRWQAVQDLATQDLLRMTTDHGGEPELASSQGVIDVFGSTLRDESLDKALRALALTLPGEADIAQEIGKNVNPDRIHAARSALRKAIADAHLQAFLEQALDQAPEGAYAPDAASAGARALANRALFYCAVAAADADGLVFDRFACADNMTDRLAALTLLVHGAMAQKDEALDRYRARHEGNSLAMDKWFMTQATAPIAGTVEKVRELMSHPLYDPGNPNRVRSLLQSFATGNPTQFARADGAGFELIAESVLEIDRKNPQVASRLLTSFRSWRALEPQRSALAETALLRVSASENLSRDSRDIVDRTLQ